MVEVKEQITEFIEEPKLPDGPSIHQELLKESYIKGLSGIQSFLMDAFKRLYPNKDFKYEGRIIFSNRLKDFNANVVKKGNILEFALSAKWRPVSKDIVMGCIQELMIKLFGSGCDSINIGLYNAFVKNLHKVIPKTMSHPLLEASFERVNEKYFKGAMEKPNMKWGKASTSTLGCYNYKNDSITMSTILKDTEEEECLDYVMYHELLHKKLKFYSINGRSFHHTAKFKFLEKQFEGFDMMEKKLDRVILRSKRKKNSKKRAKKPSFRNIFDNFG